jgi:hypothetical protein
VPEWIKTKPEDPDKFIQEFGAGKRDRKKVNYNEEFSEGQWLKIIEQGADPQEEAEKIRRRREAAANGGAQLPEKRRRADRDDVDEDESESYGGASRRKKVKIP